MARILVIDDEEFVRFTTEVVLTKAGHEITTAENGKVGLTEARQNTYDLVLTDIIMPEMEGLEAIRILRKEFPELPIIAMSGGGRTGNLDFLDAADAFGAQATLAKPFTRDQLCAIVDSVLETA